MARVGRFREKGPEHAPEAPTEGARPGGPAGRSWRTERARAARVYLVGSAGHYPLGRGGESGYPAERPRAARGLSAPTTPRVDVVELRPAGASLDSTPHAVLEGGALVEPMPHVPEFERDRPAGPISLDGQSPQGPLSAVWTGVGDASDDRGPSRPSPMRPATRVQQTSARADRPSSHAAKVVAARAASAASEHGAEGGAVDVHTGVEPLSTAQPSICRPRWISERSERHGTRPRRGRIAPSRVVLHDASDETPPEPEGDGQNPRDLRGRALLDAAVDVLPVPALARARLRRAGRRRPRAVVSFARPVTTLYRARADVRRAVPVVAHWTWFPRLQGVYQFRREHSERRDCYPRATSPGPDGVRRLDQTAQHRSLPGEASVGAPTTARGRPAPPARASNSGYGQRRRVRASPPSAIPPAHTAQLHRIPTPLSTLHPPIHSSSAYPTNCLVSLRHLPSLSPATTPSNSLCGHCLSAPSCLSPVPRS
jgi:hypothetical protein